MEKDVVTPKEEPNKYITEKEANILRDILAKAKKNRKTTHTFKNFAEICKALDKPVPIANAKVSFLKELRQYADIRQQKGKLCYRLFKVYDKPKPKVVAKTVNGALLDEIILNLCAISSVSEEVKALDGYDLELSITGFLKELNLLGDDFFRYSESKKNYSEELAQFDEELVSAVLGVYYSKNKNMLEQALKRQANYCHIRYKTDTRVIMFDGTSHYADSEEERIIANAEREVLEEMHYSSKRQVIINKSYETFAKKVKLKICEHGIKGYYKTHKIVTSDRFAKMIETRANILQKQNKLKECCVASILELLLLNSDKKREEIKYAFGEKAESYLLNPNLAEDAKKIIEISTKTKQ